MMGIDNFTNSGQGASGEAKSGSSGNVLGGLTAQGINFGNPSMANQLIVMALGCGAAYIYFTHIKKG